jgi:hypothetical protein
MSPEVSREAVSGLAMGLNTRHISSSELRERLEVITVKRSTSLQKAHRQHYMCKGPHNDEQSHIPNLATLKRPYTAALYVHSLKSLRMNEFHYFGGVVWQTHTDRVHIPGIRTSLHAGPCQTPAAPYFAFCLFACLVLLASTTAFIQVRRMRSQHCTRTLLSPSSHQLGSSLVPSKRSLSCAPPLRPFSYTWTIVAHLLHVVRLWPPGTPSTPTSAVFPIGGVVCLAGPPVHCN